MKRKILAALVLVLLLTMQAAGAEEQIESDATDLYTVYMPFVVNAEKIVLGTAINQGSMYNLDYMEIVDKYQRIAPENAGIYFFVQLYGWYAMDEIYHYADLSEKVLLYHPLRWWYGEQPADYQAWIIEAMTRYPGINDWVVVNEGWDYNGCNPTVPFIEESFQLARSVRPGATLWYNGLLFSQCEQELAIGLVQSGLADAIGVQMHHNLDTDLNLYRPLLSWLEDNGVQWAITELDVIIPAYTPSYLGLQAEAYGKAVELYLEYSGAWITTWGVSDNHSWLSWNYPLPFDSSYQPKPAWAALFGGE